MQPPSESPSPRSSCVPSGSTILSSRSTTLRRTIPRQTLTSCLRNPLDYTSSSGGKPCSLLSPGHRRPAPVRSGRQRRAPRSSRRRQADRGRDFPLAGSCAWTNGCHACQASGARRQACPQRGHGAQATVHRQVRPGRVGRIATAAHSSVFVRGAFCRGRWSRRQRPQQRDRPTRGHRSRFATTPLV
jgi:hypothetical protein